LCVHRSPTLEMMSTSTTSSSTIPLNIINHGGNNKPPPPPSAPPSLFPSSPFPYSSFTCPPYPHEHTTSTSTSAINVTSNNATKNNTRHSSSTSGGSGSGKSNKSSGKTNPPQQKPGPQALPLSNSTNNKALSTNNSTTKVTAKITLIESGHVGGGGGIDPLIYSHYANNVTSTKSLPKDVSKRYIIGSSRTGGGGGHPPHPHPPPHQVGSLTFTSFSQSGSLYSSLENQKMGKPPPSSNPKPLPSKNGMIRNSSASSFHPANNKTAGQFTIYTLQNRFVICDSLMSLSLRSKSCLSFAKMSFPFLKRCDWPNRSLFNEIPLFLSSSLLLSLVVIQRKLT